MPRDLRLYLWDMVHAGEDVQAFTRNTTFEGYELDPLLRAAVERKLEIIGEALTQARSFYPQIGNRISDEQHIVAFRNRVIHGYFQIDDDLVWSAAKSISRPC